MTVSLTPGGAIQGISFAASTEGTAYGQLNASSLHLPLTDTLVPARGTSAPTFTRPTSTWVFDNEGKLRTVQSGCARMQGARLVRNLLSASEDLNSASWTKTNLTVTSGQADPDGGTSAWKVEAASSAAITFHQPGPTGTNAKTYTYSFYVKKGSGALEANKFYLYDTTATVNVLGVTINYDTGAITYLVGSTGVTVTSAQNGFWRVEMRADAVTQGNPLRCYTFFTGAVETGGEFAYFYHPQLENVSGQADQTASEYVSVGVLSAPWHGAGVDGCKWFPTNKDGSAISASTLEGYLSEPVMTNNCLWGRDVTNAVWAKTNVTAAKTTTGLDNVANSASRLTAAANDATITQLLTAATGSRTASVWIKRISGTGTISITRNGGTAWTDVTSQLVTGTWVPVALTSDVGANPTVGLKMGTSGDVIDVDCFQDENGAWRTSPILTTTAAVTRNADVLSYASAFDVTQGTALCSCSSNSPVSTANIYALSGDTNGRLMYLNSGNARTSNLTYDGTNTAQVTGVKSINTGTRKQATRWGTDIRACVEGTLGVATAFDGSMGASTTLYIGCASSSGSQISGPIREVHIWSTPLTDAQMQQVTS